MNNNWLKFSLIGLMFSFSSLINIANAGIIYQYVGSWYVDDGPSWTSNPDVYTGQEAAAFLFGGVASDYAISTVSDQIADINFKTWLDGWGDANTYGTSGNPADHDFKVDIDGLGYNSPGNQGNSYSAFVSDHGLHLQNFAFSVTVTPDQIPEPSTFLVFALGLIGIFSKQGYLNRKANFN